MTTDPIFDHHGTAVHVELVFKSQGPFVYLTLEDERTEEFARLTPSQAVQLADRLKAAAEEAP